MQNLKQKITGISGGLIFLASSLFTNPESEVNRSVSEAPKIPLVNPKALTRAGYVYYPLGEGMLPIPVLMVAYDQNKDGKDDLTIFYYCVKPKPDSSFFNSVKNVGIDKDSQIMAYWVDINLNGNFEESEKFLVNPPQILHEPELPD